MYNSSEASRIYNDAVRASDAAIRDGQLEATKLKGNIPIQVSILTNSLSSEEKALSAVALRKKDLFIKDFERLITATRADYSSRIKFVQNQSNINPIQKDARIREVETMMNNAIADLESKKRIKLFQIDSDLQNAIKVRKQRFNESKFAVESRIKMEADRAINFAQSKARGILEDGKRRADEAEDDWERRNG